MLMFVGNLSNRWANLFVGNLNKWTFGWGPCSNFEKTPTGAPLPAFEWITCAPTERGPIGDDHPSRCACGGYFLGVQHLIFKGSPKNRYYMKRRGNDFTQNRIRESKVSHFDCSFKILGPALRLVKNLFILMKGPQTNLCYPLWLKIQSWTWNDTPPKSNLFPEYSFQNGPFFGGPNSFIVRGVHGIFRVQILWWGEAI